MGPHAPRAQGRACRRSGLNTGRRERLVSGSGITCDKDEKVLRCVVKTFSTRSSVTCCSEPFQRRPRVARELPIGLMAAERSVEE
jgi:hypothetical protein